MITVYLGIIIGDLFVGLTHDTWPAIPVTEKQNGRFNNACLVIWRPDRLAVNYPLISVRA